MTNIPTELLRTLVAVVDLRSFTKAAQSLGVTQPAVSAQIKRLQILLGGELFDKSAPGVTLTEKGDVVVNHARRLLTINDQILHLALPVGPAAPLRIGIPAELDVAALSAALAACRRRSPHLRFSIRGQSSDALLRDLGQGDLDLAVAFTQSAPSIEARHHWNDDIVWVSAQDGPIDLGKPVPLLAHDVNCVFDRLATTALAHVGRDWELVLSAPGAMSLNSAVRAGLGVAVSIRRLVETGLSVVGEDALPTLPPVVCGVYLRDEGDHEMLPVLADAIAGAIAPSAR
jgi:DNA-binding transcriptional LysR family regulator